jgi:hypothetical protein
MNFGGTQVGAEDPSFTSAAAVRHNAPNTSILLVNSTDIFSQLGS